MKTKKTKKAKLHKQKLPLLKLLLPLKKLLPLLKAKLLPLLKKLPLLKLPLKTLNIYSKIKALNVCCPMGDRHFLYARRALRLYKSKHPKQAACFGCLLFFFNHGTKLRHLFELAEYLCYFF